MVYRDYLMQQPPPVSNYVVGLCSRHRGDDRFGPHIVRMFQLLRLHGQDALAAACVLAAEEKAFGVDYLDELLGVPLPRPQITEPFSIPGVPTQDAVERGLSSYESYVVGVSADD